MLSKQYLKSKLVRQVTQQKKFSKTEANRRYVMAMNGKFEHIHDGELPFPEMAGQVKRHVLAIVGQIMYLYTVNLEKESTMNFLIDYDTLSVECKSTDADALQNYIEENDLGLALALIGGEDDLQMEMSLAEVSKLFHNLSERDRKFESEEEAAEITYALLQGKAGEFPDFTPALGKKLLKAGEKRSADTARGKAGTTGKTASKSATKAPSSGKGSQGKRIKDDTVLTLGNEPKANTLPRKVWDIVDDNMGEATVAEVVENRGDMEEDACRKQIARCVRKGFLNKGE